jgi:pimeloyl-ACP methyl ester carboxylesterase
MNDTDIKPFEVHVPDEAILDLKERLARTRWPDELNDENWRYGTSMVYLKELCAYWASEFDWRAVETQLNTFAQFKTRIEGLDLHFIHVRSRHEHARPMIITHGWPGSVLEFMDLIPRLTDPTAHGGKAEDAFHVVCPSMPGYGFSEASKSPGMTPASIAKLQVQLMAKLGYKNYIAQGGDWGSMVSTEMARADQSNCAGLHLNMLIALPPEGDNNAMGGLSAEEAHNMQNSTEFSKEGMGYYQIQSTKPQTLGYGLTDSPAGQAAWIVEKFRAWSDCDGDVERSYNKDQLLGNISLYWFTATATSSARLYFETVHSKIASPYVKVPTGAALFPKELMKSPRKWADAAYNIVHWESYPRGGHFAAMEVPDLLTEDIRKFNRLL